MHQLGPWTRAIHKFDTKRGGEVGKSKGFSSRRGRKGKTMSLHSLKNRFYQEKENRGNGSGGGDDLAPPAAPLPNSAVPALEASPCIVLALEAPPRDTGALATSRRQRRPADKDAVSSSVLLYLGC